MSRPDVESRLLEQKKYKLDRTSFFVGTMVALFLGIGGWGVNGIFTTKAIEVNEDRHELEADKFYQEKFDTNVSILFDENSRLRSRMVAISSLDRLMQDYPSSQAEIIKELAYFVQTQPAVISMQHSNGKFTRFLNDDVNKALSVIVSYSSKEDSLAYNIIMNHADLPLSSFKYGNFEGGSFVNAKLQDSFWNAANCSQCNFTTADMRGSDLKGLNLRGANIHLADFRGAQNLTVEQIKSAKNWQSGKYDDDLRQALELPLENNKQMIKTQ